MFLSSFLPSHFLYMLQSLRNCSRNRWCNVQTPPSGQQDHHISSANRFWSSTGPCPTPFITFFFFAFVVYIISSTFSPTFKVHISLAGKDHVKVSWVTIDKHVPSVVDYGTRPGEYDASMTGFHTSYRYIFYKSGKLHHVKIGPLNPKTTYYYRCGGQGKEFSFTTPPSSYPIEFAVAGNITLFTFN